MKLRKKLMLLEDFDAQSNAKVNTEVKAEVKTETKTGEAIRTEVIADVDAILTNLETLSAQMSEGNVTLNESFDDLIKQIMSTAMYGRAKSMLGEFEKLATDADQNILDGRIASKTEGLLKTKLKLKLAKEKAKGPQKEKITKEIDKLSAQEDKITAYKEKTKAKADDVLTAFNTKYSKVEGQVIGKLKELLAAEKAQVTSDVKQAGLKSKAELLIKKGEKERAIAAKTELEELAADRKAIDDKIAAGKDVSADEIAELKGMQPFMAEIEAFTKARTEVSKVEAEITSAVPQYNLGESLGIDQTLSFLIETEILNLFTKAKGDEDKEEAKKNLETAKKLSAAVKKASGEEWKAKKALHDKVAAAPKVTTKSLITLAGGDADAAQEVDGGYKLGALIPKWGGEEGFISAEEFSPIKKAIEVENGVDQAIKDLENTPTGEAKSVEDVAKEAIGEETYGTLKKIPAGTQDDKHPEKTDADGNTIQGKDKWIEKQGPFRAKNAEGEDEGEEFYFGKEQSNESLEVNENHPNFDAYLKKQKKELKKAKKAIEQGETVYAENVRFPGRFKIVELGDINSKVDYEDGTGQMYMDSLNIAIDKLQFESVEIEDVNEGISPKIKKAIKAVEKGETVYGENIRFPGRFKILSFNKAGNMATVDYEDGTDAFDMAAMNIAIDKLQFESVETEDVNEGLHPKLKKAMKAVEKGETVYGENVRFPGRFKIIEMGELFATVDYEDGTDPMEMASMNIRIDSLQFESVEIEEGNEFGAARAEAIAKGEKTFKVGDEEYPVEDVSKEDEENAEEFVEEAKEELPKTIKLDEGLTIAQRFSKLM